MSVRTKATLSDIAKLVGVDKSTVSIVLRQKKTGMRISDGTQRRVFSAAKELDYRPNIMARGLTGGQTHSVGVVWDMSIPQAGVAMTRDFANRVRNHQYTSYIIDSQCRIEVVLEALRDFSNRGVDGVIVELGITTLTDEQLKDEQLEELATSLKSFSAAVAVCKIPIDLKVDRIDHDRLAAIRSVADHFVKVGRTQPGIATADSAGGTLGLKSRTFKSRLEEHGVEMPKENVLNLENTFGLSYGYRLADSCHEAFDKQFGDGKVPFDSLLCSADEEAMAAIAWLNSKGYRVPQDVAVVGFNNYGSSKYVLPPLASVERKDQDVAAIAEDMLFSRLENSDLPIRTEAVAMEFVWRESAG